MRLDGSITSPKTACLTLWKANWKHRSLKSGKIYWLGNGQLRGWTSWFFKSILRKYIVQAYFTSSQMDRYVDLYVWRWLCLWIRFMPLFGRMLLISNEEWVLSNLYLLMRAVIYIICIHTYVYTCVYFDKVFFFIPYHSRSGLHFENDMVKYLCWRWIWLRKHFFALCRQADCLWIILCKWQTCGLFLSGSQLRTAQNGVNSIFWVVLWIDFVIWSFC